MVSDVMQSEVHQTLSDKVSELLQERQQMLVLFCRVAGLDSYTDKLTQSELLENFCQILVDYSALWHFEILEGVVRDNDRFADAFKQVNHVNDRILEANEVAVAFNDKYDASDHVLAMEHFNQDLSLLGEEIAGRIEAEDHILQAMRI